MVCVDACTKKLNIHVKLLKIVTEIAKAASHCVFKWPTKAVSTRPDKGSNNEDSMEGRLKINRNLSELFDLSIKTWRTCPVI